MVSKQSTKDLTLRGWSLLNVVLLVYLGAMVDLGDKAASQQTHLLSPAPHPNQFLGEVTRILHWVHAVDPVEFAEVASHLT